MTFKARKVKVHVTVSVFKRKTALSEITMTNVLLIVHSRVKF